MTLYRSIAALWFVAISVLPAAAQTDQGKVGGTVRDQSGAFVPGAKVTARNERTGEQRSALTNDQGYFLISYLKPSSYAIKAEHAGFAAIEYTAMALAVGQELTLDFEIKPAGIQEDVTVVGSSPVLDISSARLGVNVSTREVESLPVNGRQMSQLLLQAPGSQNAGTGTWQDIRFSGRAVEQNVIRYDGIEGSAIIDAAPGNLNGEIPTPFKLQASLENVQEFRVESSSYPAEYGTGTGGQVSVITKSGSNSVHGSAFEYVRSEKLDAPNYFDTAAGLPKSTLKQNQFGGSLGGPIARNRAFFFGSYEGYRLDAGLNFVEAAPSAAAWARAVPAIAALRPGFVSPNAVILPGKSSNPDFDIAQLQGMQDVREHALSARFDVKINSRWSSYVRVFHDQGTNNQPEGVTGRVVHITDNPSNAVFNLQALLSDSTTNEFKFGYNASPTRIDGQAPTVNGIDFSRIAINLSGSVANTGIAGQGASSGIAVPGGLVRANSATNGHGQPYDPYSLTLADTLSRLAGSHYIKAGGEFRLIRMTTDRIGGTTYTFANITSFLADQAQTVQYLGDVSGPSVFNNGATGPRHSEQQYAIGYIQDEWHVRPSVTLNYGVRYDYYTPLKERDNLVVKFNIDTGIIDPNTTPFYTSRKNSFQPRVSTTIAASEKTLVRAGFGIFVGPGQTEDQIQPIESDRISSTISNSAYPVDVDVLRANFINNPNNRSFQPRAYANDYSVPERVYQYTASAQRDLGRGFAATAAYVGSQGRNLFLRSVANQITAVVTNPNPASAALVIRQFSIVQHDAAGNVIGVQNPYAEVDFKTSGGHDRYDAMQLSLTRRSLNGITMNGQYTLGRSYGNTGGSNEALTAANNALTPGQFEYDNGYNLFDVRHAFNLSAVYEKRGWQVGGIFNARSGLPVDVRVTRPDVVYTDGTNFFLNPAADRIAVINTPGGGASRNVRRPDLVAGVDPFIHSGGLLFLNPAAFATPLPGTFGNLERNSIHGPGFHQVDLVVGKRLQMNNKPGVELRMEVFNIFNTDNFSNPVGTLPSALPASALTEANKVQPGQPFTTAAAGTFGTLTSTVGRTVGLGTNRQIQFAVRLTF
jgi:Carboxypeptidase regulatory-like domain